MSIWTRSAGSSSARPLAATPWRAVEAQHVVATRKLVDSDWEQDVLEALIDGAKPPRGEPESRLHYLLSTTFRYAPLRGGTRFGTRHERGIWYGADDRETTFAEVSYYRLLFLEGTAAELAPLTVELTLFRARVRTTRGVDLTRPPFDALRGRISSPLDYTVSQRLGRDMREDGIEVARFGSARRPGGTNYAVFTPDAFSARDPFDLETWTCTTTRERVELRRRSYFEAEAYQFARESFLVRGELPHPALP